MTAGYHVTPTFLFKIESGLFGFECVCKRLASTNTLGRDDSYSVPGTAYG
jgi:hypothetical protein